VIHRLLSFDSTNRIHRCAPPLGNLSGREARLEQHLNLVPLEKGDHLPCVASLGRHQHAHHGYEQSPNHSARSFRFGAAEFPERDAAEFPEPSHGYSTARVADGYERMRPVFLGANPNQTFLISALYCRFDRVGGIDDQI
jgi:hypothetical protein